MKANKKIMQKAVAWILAAMLLLSGQAVSVFAGESAVSYTHLTLPTTPYV